MAAVHSQQIYGNLKVTLFSPGAIKHRNGAFEQGKWKTSISISSFCSHQKAGCPLAILDQWEFQDPKMEVLYGTVPYFWPYFGGISPYIALEWPWIARGSTHARYLRSTLLGRGTTPHLTSAQDGSNKKKRPGCRAQVLKQTRRKKMSLGQDLTQDFAGFWWILMVHDGHRKGNEKPMPCLEDSKFFIWAVRVIPLSHPITPVGQWVHS